MRDQIAAARRAGIAAETVNSANTDDWDEIHDAHRGRRGRPARGVARAAQLAGLPRRGAAPAHRRGRACSSSTRRTASPTGATTSGPTTAASATCWPASATSPCWPARRRPTTAWSPTWPTSWAPIPWSSGATSTAPSLHLSVLELDPAERLAWLAAHLGDLPGSGIVYTLTVAAHRDRWPSGCAGPGHDGRRLLGRHRRRPSASASSTRCGPTSCKAVVATSALGHGLRQGRRRASWSTSAPRRRPSPTTSRSAAPAGPSTGPRSCSCPGAEDQAIWSLVRLDRLPARGAGAPGARRALPPTAGPWPPPPSSTG